MKSFDLLSPHTIAFGDPPKVTAWHSTVGPMEAEGPLGGCFDKTESDPYFGQPSWECAESTLFKNNIINLLDKECLKTSDIDFMTGGDLLNQCTASGFAARDLAIPHIGLYGACSTMAESLLVGSLLVSGGASRVIASACSHFCSAEKQYRYPLEYGSQRTPHSQWTVTGSGAVLLGTIGSPMITHATCGTVIDYGITDQNHMGAAMAPAFADTIKKHLTALNASPKDYSMIFSGDLGKFGKKIAIDLLKADGIDISQNFEDCGCLIYDPNRQDVHAGGSGCGCSASVLAGYILPAMRKGKMDRVLFVATGALLSPLTTQQGESIPSIAHAIEFRTP